MKILNKENNLIFLLSNIKQREVTIVSAFASQTENIVDLLIKNNNKLELIIGTINSFSSPDFFDHCMNIVGKDFSLRVDFGYQNSTHWKLYLVNPDIVIIGSANFTNTGLSLSRDTCVVIEDKGLFDNYKNEVDNLKNSKNVIESHHEEFKNRLDLYRRSHRRMQAGLVNRIQMNDGVSWLEEESNQLIPLFIWDCLHSKESTKIAHKLLEDDVTGDSKSTIRDFFTYECADGELPYSQGDVVLCLNDKGNHVDFYSFDRIIHKDGINYIYSFKRKRYIRPFAITQKIKNEIKNIVDEWYGEKLIELNRNKIARII